MDTDLQEKCRRFRVLVIGKANAGKTTILQKMCGTTENPVIHNRYGEEITLQVTAGRGIHNINDEWTFPNNPGFVFHDSCGFEAGSAEEVENVSKFIATRATSRLLEAQVHIVWICLPTDNSRPLQRAEMAFFEHGTGNVPAVAIFTKFDGLDLVHFAILRDEGKSRSQARLEAPKLADIYFQEHHLKRIQSTKYPPASYVCLRNMHKPETECSELTQKTMEAIDNKVLQRLFASVQNNNIQIHINWAIDEVIDHSRGIVRKEVVTKESMTSIGLKMLSWFPHVMSKKGKEYIDNDPDASYVDSAYDGYDGVRRVYFRDFEDVYTFESRWEAALDPVVESLAGLANWRQLLILVATVSIIAEHSFQLLKHQKTSDVLQGLDSYLKSPQPEAVKQAVDDAFPVSPWDRGGGMDIKRKLRETVLANLMPRD